MTWYQYHCNWNSFALCLLLWTFHHLPFESQIRFNSKNKWKIARFHIEFHVNFVLLIRTSHGIASNKWIYLAFADHSSAKPRHSMLINTRIVNCIPQCHINSWRINPFIFRFSVLINRPFFIFNLIRETK